MLKIIGNDVMRDGMKVGYFNITTRHLYSNEGKKLGHFDHEYIYNVAGKKVAKVEGDYLVSISGERARLKIDEVTKSIQGGIIPLTGKCAIYMLIGA